MAKNKVTKDSLRVGQTVYIVYRYMYGDYRFVLQKCHMTHAVYVNTVINLMNGVSEVLRVEQFYFFYSKKKAKSKMLKLNERL
jgi:hypothetical protein